MWTRSVQEKALRGKRSQCLGSVYGLSNAGWPSCTVGRSLRTQAGSGISSGVANLRLQYCQGHMKPLAIAVKVEAMIARNCGTITVALVRIGGI